MSRRCFALLATLAVASAQAHNGTIHTHDLVGGPQRLEGLRTFDIGPGWPDTFDSVPFASLQPGDVVNIHFREEPYRYKFALRAQGTADNPVFINGVVDPDGRKPILDFENAVTAPGSALAFSEAPEYGESLGGIQIKRGQGDSYFGQKPSFIRIQNLELRNVTGTYTGIGGVVREYGDVTTCIYIHASADLILENLDVHDCNFGVLVLAKDGLMSQNSERFILRNSKFWNCGRPWSWFEHCAYVQAAGALVEGNYFGKLVPNAEGSSFKDRSAGLVFRNNFVLSNSRSIDLVESEDQDIDGIITLPSYGTDWVYGNTFVVDSSETAIHHGADNNGEQDFGDELFIPSVRYREVLYFYDNLVTYTLCGWRNMVFDLSTRDTIVEAWNNTFNFNTCTENHHLVEWAGTVRLGPNTFNGPIQFNGRDGYNPDFVRITTGHSPPF